MLIKIGSALVDPEEIVAIKPYPDGHFDCCDQSVLIDIILRNSTSFLTDSTMDEAEAALIDAGVVTDLTADHDPVPPLTDAEVKKLYELKYDGYKYLARDKDGTLYAFQHKPKYGGFYWDDPDPAPALHVDGLSFVSEEDEEPTEICSLIENLS